MKRKIASVVTLMALSLALSACVVAGPGPGYGRCGGAGWVPGHYGPGGGWIPAHCR